MLLLNLNDCKTKMGKRETTELLLNPINDEKVLKESYNNVDYILNHSYECDSFLGKIKDLDKLTTKRITFIGMI